MVHKSIIIAGLFILSIAVLSEIVIACHFRDVPMWYNCAEGYASPPDVTVKDWMFDIDGCVIGINFCLNNCADQWVTWTGSLPYQTCSQVTEAKWLAPSGGSYNGYICKIREGWSCSFCFPDTSCGGNPEGRWDVTEQKCVACSAGKQTMAADCNNMRTGWDYSTRCESACPGADAACDERSASGGDLAIVGAYCNSQGVNAPAGTTCNSQCKCNIPASLHIDVSVAQGSGVAYVYRWSGGSSTWIRSVGASDGVVQIPINYGDDIEVRASDYNSFTKFCGTYPSGSWCCDKATCTASLRRTYSVSGDIILYFSGCTDTCSPGTYSYSCSGDWLRRASCVTNYDSDPCYEWGAYTNYQNCAVTATDTDGGTNYLSPGTCVYRTCLGSSCQPVPKSDFCPSTTQVCSGYSNFCDGAYDEWECVLYSYGYCQWSGYCYPSFNCADLSPSECTSLGCTLSAGGSPSQLTEYTNAGTTCSSNTVDCASLYGSSSTCSGGACTGNPCTKVNPSVLISPDSQSGNGGISRTYTVSVRNQDNPVSACSVNTYTMYTTCPSGWTCSLSKSSVNVYPQATDSSTTVTVTPPISASVGTYSFSVTAYSGSYNSVDSANYVTSCPCSSGVCCDGCNYRPSSYICNSNLQTDYSCPWGTGCGNDVGVRHLQQYCSGSSTTCNGATSWTGYSLYDDCITTSERCVEDVSSCTPDASCAGTVCTPNGCNGNCPAGCTVSQDPDCGCSNGNGCCGIGCTYTNDNDCTVPCIPDGCNGNCPTSCSVSQDPDCGCSNGNGCCGIGCTSSNDNDCAPSCIPNGCNGNCPSGCTASQDPDCGCVNGNGCCAPGCTYTNDNDCSVPCIPDGCNGNCPQYCTVSQDPDCGCFGGNGCCPSGCVFSNDNDCAMPTISASASPSSVIADGSSSSTIVATLSNGASGVWVSFSTTLGALTPAGCTTSGGTCSVTIRSSAAGTATVTLSASGYSPTTTPVTFSCECSGGACCSDGCHFDSPSRVCRAVASGSDCDVAEYCTGSSASCPADSFVSGTLCRSSTGFCDPAEYCSGSSAYCPSDSFTADGTKCGLCMVCSSGTCSGVPADDGACGIIDCDGLDVTCRNYNDLNGVNAGRCEGLGDCKDPNTADCTVYSDLDGTSCGIQECDSSDGCDTTNPNIFNDYNDCNFFCSGGICPTSCTCGLDQHDCSQPGNWDGDDVECNCNCNGYDIEENETNGNTCSDEIDNDCDGLVDGEEFVCPDNTMTFRGNLQYSTGYAVSDSRIEVIVENSALGIERSAFNQTAVNGDFVVTLLNLPTRLMSEDFDMSIYVEGEVDALYECRYDVDDDYCYPV